MELTPRQRQFYQTLVALCRAAGRSVHYSAVAHALGVSPFSAYDMLKVLERKGVVAAEYVLEASSHSPGRSAIMFHPLPLPMAGAAAGAHDEAEWSRLRQRLLQCLREVRDTNVRETLGDLLGRLPDCGSPLSYCTAAIAAHLVNLRASGQELFGRAQLPALQTLVSSDEVGLGTLAGLSIGSSLGRSREAPSWEPLLQSARRFQVQLATLSTESRQRLAEFLGEALSAIQSNPS